jgi:hypothetical protein
MRLAIVGRVATEGREAGAHRVISLEQHYATALVTRCEVVSSGVKLDGRNDIGCPGFENVSGTARKMERAFARGSRVRGRKGPHSRRPDQSQREDSLPSVMSSTSPLSPKHWANRQPPEASGSMR